MLKLKEQRRRGGEESREVGRVERHRRREKEKKGSQEGRIEGREGGGRGSA